MKNAAFGLILALQFLTRLPVSVACPWTPETRRWAVRAYPLVGALVGGVLALAAYLMSQGVPAVPAPLAALFLLSLWVGLSGGLHLDGLMDMADALGSNQPLERRFAIMQDPQVGSFGMLALFFLLAWKGVLLWALIAQAAPFGWLVMVPALGRWLGAASLALIPCAKPSGLAHAWQRSLTAGDAALALAAPLALAFVWPGVWPALVAAGLYFLIARRALKRGFGGITGDLAGAMIEGGELWLLLCLWSWWQFATA
ncbi:adenosylcobinamide-GDP ribazoletransferase [Halomonas piscis]|uniref:Adenosylcobinamide-GDP ribazoletransferase n=1 Tax=Halomonas piscis TaxID=3031727 RepID=A0ABY9YYP1_9GAMM|nr:adenosylcobinamide-GDP ribazoletransferase [Halomonas piscis]WNK19168.1 adenosylcobinamide-GDP ribazoletransferase [Halomonas piscis]